MSYFRQIANHQVSISNSSVATQTIQAASSIDISNSAIDYTPHPLAKKVVYEGSFYLTTSYRMYCAINLLEYTGGSWSEVDSKDRRTFFTNQFNYGNTNELNAYVKYMIDPWQGSRSFKLILNNRSSSWNARLHRTMKWEGTTSTDAYIMPQFMMYSVL